MERTELLKQSYKKMKSGESLHTEIGSAGPVKAKNPRAVKLGGPKTNRTEHMALRVTKETRKAVELAAYDTHRTAANWIETAICWALKEGAVKTRQVVPRPGGEK